MSRIKKINLLTPAIIHTDNIPIQVCLDFIDNVVFLQNGKNLNESDPELASEILEIMSEKKRQVFPKIPNTDEILHSRSNLTKESINARKNEIKFGTN